MERKLNLGLIGLLVLAGLAIALLLAVNPASAGYTGDAPPAAPGQDWNINNPTHVWDQDVYVYDGDINVNSRLTLHNVNVYIGMMMVFDYNDFKVNAGGSVMANDSLVSGSFGSFDFDVDGTVDFERCRIEYLMNMTTDGTAKFYNRTSIYYVEYADLGGTVTIDDNSYFELGNQELTMRGTVHVWDNSRVQRIYGDFNITGTVDFEASEIYYIYNHDVLVSGTLKMNGSVLRYLRQGLNVTGGTFSFTNGYGYDIYGMLLDGDTTIDLSTFYYTHQGVHVMVDKVSVTNSNFMYMYDMGFHFVDCTASLNNVTIDVFSGTNVGHWTTDHTGDWDDRFNMYMGLGIWVEGGAPTFVDVDVEADCYGEFHVNYTGSEQEARVYVRAVMSAVLIDSTDMKDVSGLTVHNSYMSIRVYFTASNPGPNPQYFYGYVEVWSGGIAVVDYSNVTISDVEAWDNRRGGMYGPYMSGQSMSGRGYWSTNSYWQVLSFVYGDYTSSPSPMMTVRDLEIDDASYWFVHNYEPRYTGTGAPQFEDNLYFDNVTVNYNRDYAFRIEINNYFDGKRTIVTNVHFANCYFTGLTYRLINYYLNVWNTDPSSNLVDITETFSFNNNTLTESTYRWGYLTIGSGGSNMPNDKWDKTATIADNDFINFNGRIFDSWAHWDFVKGKERFLLLNNKFENLTDATGNTNPFYLDAYDTILFKGNSFKDMEYSYTADIYDYGGSNSGVKLTDWQFRNNTWDNCTNKQYSEIIFLEFGGDVLFDGNEVMNQNGLISIMPWMEYSGVASMTISNNEFHDNMAYFVEYGNPEPDFPSFMMTIKGNEVYNNEDFFLNYWGRDSTLTNFDYDATFVITENDFHDNMGGCIHAWGDVSARNNTFTNNVGPLLYIDYINLNVPDVGGNALVNNGDLFMFEAKDRGYQLVPMTLEDQALSCSGTALHLTNMEVTMMEVDISGAETAILAWNSIVNAYSSTIDGDTCRVVSDGLITTWWPLEVSVTWGDMHGMDSGTPVVDALVVFNTVSGDYYRSEYVDENGMLAESDYQQWSVDLSGVSWLSAYTMKVAASGATNETEVELDMELIGPDKVHLVLWDIFPPTVAITEPFNGAIFADDTVETFGFVAEVGSGMETIEYSTDGGDTWEALTVSPTGDWTLTLGTLPDGDVSLMVRAMDVAGNTADTKVTITIDTTPPALSVNPLPTITNVADVTITGSVEVGAEVFLNGQSLGEAVDATLSIDHALHEGTNIIVLEAKDMAGNMAMQTISVRLDTHEPVLVVSGPAVGLITNEDSVHVTGVVEVDATLTVGGTQVMPDESGAFTYEYMLSSGENLIEVKATDDATNVNMVTIGVTQDQDPPHLEISDPQDGDITADTRIDVTLISDDDAVLWLNGRMLSEAGTVQTSVLLIEGANTLTARAMDVAGNVATVSITVTRDTEPPSLAITEPDVMQVMTNAESIDIEGVALKATSVKAGGVTADLQEDGTFTVSVPLTDGENNITVEASDGVNVVSQMVYVVVSRDRPALTVASQEAVVKTPSVTISGETDPGIGHVVVTYTGFEGVFPVAFDGTYAVKLNMVDGTYDVKVSVEDEFGNTAEASTGSFTVKAKGISDGDGEDEGFSVEPIHIGLILAVIGIALIIAAYVSANYITKRRREELDESD